MLTACMIYLKARLGSKKGQGMVEYALIIGLVAVVLIGVLTAMQGSISIVFNTIKDKLTGVGDNT